MLARKASARRTLRGDRGASLALVGATLLALAAMGCGPSLRRVEQANVYFERCHAADRDPVRTNAERRSCWQAWRDHYAVGQPDDRVDYVRERLFMLDPSSGDAIALATTDELMPDPSLANDGTVEAQLATTPAVDTDAPPEGPELSDTIADRPPRARRRPVPPRTRTSACGTGCEPAYVTCAGACAVADRGCADACRHTFRVCARGCF